MLLTFALTVAILALVVLGASIGVLFKRKPIQGSCGGLDALGITKACSCKTPCSEALEAQAAKNLEAAKAKQHQDYSATQSDYVADRTGEGTYSSK
ncbi:hypothetical protein CKF54_05715 [Psittacicella hinzii]|uniref:(Na+)-NQR maturation NqrM n=1 Tax=Psittacicella hinzii TaxID=2028575 RepID=A0A3A1Y3V8_9GAMM|nr:(Na+)-NQR maturation NqrM [Psittacicella hinzii]RIY31936.1 hypothetical protein CKF54_05715 [Psittacicella hinzii]